MDLIFRIVSLTFRIVEFVLLEIWCHRIASTLDVEKSHLPNLLALAFVGR